MYPIEYWRVALGYLASALYWVLESGIRIFVIGALWDFEVFLLFVYYIFNYSIIVLLFWKFMFLEN